MSELEEIKKHWDERAALSNAATGNTLGDDNLRNLEIEAVAKHLHCGQKVLDVGCGNGFSTLYWARNCGVSITGMDYSSAMIANANEILAAAEPGMKDRVDFLCADVMDPAALKNEFDVIITERCLINLKSWENQQQAILNIRRWLKPGGLLLLLEGFIDKLNDLNEIRARLGLDAIKVVWHNRFFVMSEMQDFLGRHFDLIHKDNFGSTYMLLTRTIYHAINREGEDFDARLDYLATLLPNIGDYNYQQLLVLKAKIDSQGM